MCNGKCSTCGLCGSQDGKGSPVVIYCVVRKTFMCHNCFNEECRGYVDHQYCDLVHC